MTFSLGWLARIEFALPDDGLPFGAIRLLHRRLLHDEQTGEWLWVAHTRQALRELVRQKRVRFANGRYCRIGSPPAKPPMPVYLPTIDRFRPVWPEVSRGPWTFDP